MLVSPPVSLDLFAPGSATVMVLFGVRMSGLMLVAPVFSNATVPPTIRTAVLVVLTVLLQPVALSHAATNVQVTPATALGELLIGFAIGLGAAVFVGAAEAAGDLIAIQIGLSGAALVDPLNQGAQAPVLATFTQMFALCLMLALNAHLVMIESVAASTRVLPVGSAMNFEGGVGAMMSMMTSLFAIGLRFAAPVIAAILITNTALAVLGRAAPQLNILSVAFPIQISIGLLALAALLPLIAAFYTSWQGGYDGMLTQVFRGFSTLPVGGR